MQRNNLSTHVSIFSHARCERSTIWRERNATLASPRPTTAKHLLRLDEVIEKGLLCSILDGPLLGLHNVDKIFYKASVTPCG